MRLLIRYLYCVFADPTRAPRTHKVEKGDEIDWTPMSAKVRRLFLLDNCGHETRHLLDHDARLELQSAGMVWM